MKVESSAAPSTENDLVEDNGSPNFDKLIQYYKSNPAPSQATLADGETMLRSLFRLDDDIVVKSDRTAKSTACHVIHGHEGLPPGLGTFNPMVFLLNPVNEVTVKSMRDGQPVSLGIGATGNFQNFRFEWDDDGHDNQVDKVTQLKFLAESGLPITVLLDTGNRSVHAVVSVDGITSLEEYRLIAVSIMARLPGFIDHQAIEPNQPIWLPGGRRLNDESDIVYPRLLYAGTPVAKSTIYSWIANTTIKRPELLTHLRDLPGIKSDGYEFEPNSKLEELILSKVKELGGEIVRRHRLGWTAHCPFHNDKRSPSALVFKNGFVTCKSSNCIGGGWVIPEEARRHHGDGPSEFSRYELKEAYEIGLSEDDLRDEKENEKYFVHPIPLTELFRNRRKLLNRLGTESSTAFALSFDSVKDCLAVYGRLRSLGQACFYGKGDGGEYYVCCIFGRQVAQTELSDFIDGVAAYGLLQKRPTVAPITSAAHLSDFKVCALKHDWGVSPTSDDVESMLQAQPHFWTANFLPPKDTWPNEPRKFRRLVELFPVNAKKITPDIVTKFVTALTPVERHAEPHKFEVLPAVIGPKNVDFTSLGEAGVAIGYLIEKGYQIGKSTSQNFGSLPKFRQVLSLQESRKKPIVTDSSLVLTGDKSQDLLYIIESHLAKGRNPYFGIVAPAGFGKTTFLQQFLPANLNRLRLYSVLVARERVLDVIEGEGKANDWETTSVIGGYPSDLLKSEKITRLQSVSPMRKIRVGTAVYGADDADDTATDYADDETDLTDEQSDAEIESIEENLTAAKPATAFSVVTYSYDICQRTDKGTLDTIAPDFCSNKCKITQCRAHPKHRAQALHQPFVISTHEGANQSKTDLTNIYTEPRKHVQRDAVIFDEKPSGVFEEYSITVTEDSIDVVDQIIATIPKDIKKKVVDGQATAILGVEYEEKSLPEILSETRNYLLGRLSDMATRLKQLNGPKNADSYLCLAQRNPVSRLGNRTLEFALLGASAKQKNKKAQYDIQNLAGLCKSLQAYDGPIIESYKPASDKRKHSLTITWGKPQWANLRRSWRKTFIVMDATAHLDPDYSMPGAPDLIRVPTQETFPNMTIHCTSPKDISAKRFVDEWDQKYSAELQSLVKSITEKYPGEKILIVTKKFIKDKVADAVKSWPHVLVDHFGNLKGSNDYRDCTHIVFTNFMRWSLDSYVLRALWLSESGAADILAQRLTPAMNAKSGLMIPKGKFSTAAEFRNQGLEMLRLQYETPDVIQTIMRTALRDNPQNAVHVWLPGQNPRKIGMLLDYFVGAKVALMVRTKI